MVKFSKNGRIAETEFDSVGADHIWNAAQRLIENGRPDGYRESTDYLVMLPDGTKLEPKPLFGLAASEALGMQVTGKHFTGGLGTKCFSMLELAGFNIFHKDKGVSSESSLFDHDLEWTEGDKHVFETGGLYSRVDDIHEKFGGGRQSGISPSARAPFVFIFSGKSGQKYGYDDGWQGNETFLYTGEGQVGDMEFTRGNRAIRDHAKDGRDILLFEMLGKGQPYQFLGEFACASWQVDRGPDKNGDMRDAIRFHLVRTDGTRVVTADEEPTTSGLSLEELRKRAFASIDPEKTASIKQAKARLRARSEAVKEYVLARADGVCELTGKPAPFVRKSGTPYLEVHHTRRLSDNGPDDPRWVAAIDPTLHREIHHGVNGADINKRLQEKLKVIEPNPIE